MKMLTKTKTGTERYRIVIGKEGTWYYEVRDHQNPKILPWCKSTLVGTIKGDDDDKKEFIKRLRKFFRGQSDLAGTILEKVTHNLTKDFSITFWQLRYPDLNANMEVSDSELLKLLQEYAECIGA